MKVLLIDGVPYFYRPENEGDEREMLMSLVRAVRGKKLKIPKHFKDMIDSLMKLAGKNFEEALKTVRFDSNLQSLCSTTYATEHPTYNPSEVNEVKAEDELDPKVLTRIREYIKTYNVRPLKRTDT